MSDQSIEQTAERFAGDHAWPINRLKRAVTGAPIFAFVLLAFAWTWAIDGIALLAFEAPSEFHSLPRAWGPLIAGVAVVWLLDEDIRSFVGQVKHVRVGLHWYALAFAIPVLLTDIEPLVALALGAEVGVELVVPLIQYLVSFFLVLFLAGGLEEFGWRGFAQVRLQERYSALVIAAIVGILWTSWHLPLYLLYDLAAYDATALHTVYVVTICWSIILAWMYNSTNGGLLVVMIAHAAGNLPPFLSVTGETPGPVATLPMTELAYTTVALAVVLYAGSRTLSRGGELPPVAGRRTTDDE